MKTSQIDVKLDHFFTLEVKDLLYVTPKTTIAHETGPPVKEISCALPYS